MTRIFSFFILAAIFSSASALAAPDSFNSKNPPPLEITSLAEQLAPLIKANPELPQALPASVKHDKTETTAATQSSEPLSPVEDAFSQRASHELRLFGYNQIGQNISAAPTTGQVQDDVILGTGDKIKVTFRGQRDDSKTYTITPQGELIVNGLDPITAGGITVGALRDKLEQETASHLSNSTVFVSVNSLRQLAVTVMGEVQQPGVFTVNPFQTVLDALTMAHGITKNGSLRDVKLLRGGKTITLDFYQLLLQGDLGTPIQLRDGDKIMIPVLGETIAIAGDVKRPGIFERGKGEKTFTFDDVLQLAGGPLRPGANRFVKLSLNSWGDERVTDIAAGDTVSFEDGDMLMVTGGIPMRTNGITVAGHVRQPGTQPLNKTPDLKTLLNNPRVLDEGVYPLIGVIERLDTRTLVSTLIEFSPTLVLQNKENKSLQERDRVLFFGIDDIRQIMEKKSDVMNEKEKQEKDATQIPTDLENIETLRNKTRISGNNALLTPRIVDFLNDRTVAINGAVLQPGVYPVSGKISLLSILKAAGGLKPEAANSRIDIQLSNAKRDGKRYTIDMKKDRPSDILIAAKDKINVSARYTAAENRGIQIIGEVKRPGMYDLRKGDTMMDVIERAGGMTDLAYAAGTVFMRESERLKQEEQYKNAARTLDMEIAGYYMQKDIQDKNPDELKLARKVSSELREVKALGRIVVETDPATLAEHPERAMLLQQGDRIFIPRVSPTVTVAGEVFSPATLQYNPRNNSNDYIKQAGNATKLADTQNSFVLLPDGSASPISRWISSGNIPAGSIIFVPRDNKPFDTFRLLDSLGYLMSQVAITTLTAVEIQRYSYYY